MSVRSTRLTITLIGFAVAIPTASSSQAAPSTSRGLISIAQVEEMLEKAPTDRTAQQVLTAYLAGVGEAASEVVGMGGATCRSSLRLNAANVDRALRSAAKSRDAAEAPATPLIVRDMLDRAGCSR